MPMFDVACGSGEDGRGGLQAHFLGFGGAGEAQDCSADAITPVYRRMSMQPKRA